MFALFLVHLIRYFAFWMYISIMVCNIIFPNKGSTRDPSWRFNDISTRDPSWRFDDVSTRDHSWRFWWCSTHVSKIWTVRLWFWISLLFISIDDRMRTGNSITVPTWKSRLNVLLKNVFTYMCSKVLPILCSNNMLSGDQNENVVWLMLNHLKIAIVHQDRTWDAWWTFDI